jgi:hypothetical protein
MNTTFKYGGDTPGADSDDYVLFDTTEWFTVAGTLQALKNTHFHVDLVNAEAGTITAYKSADRGVTWTVVDTDSVAASGTDSNYYEFHIAPYLDWKVVWTNGGAEQTTWEVSMAATTEKVLS